MYLVVRNHGFSEALSAQRAHTGIDNGRKSMKQLKSHAGHNGLPNCNWGCPPMLLILLSELSPPGGAGTLLQPYSSAQCLCLDLKHPHQNQFWCGRSFWFWLPRKRKFHFCLSVSLNMCPTHNITNGIARRGSKRNLSPKGANHLIP